jgi:ribonuclease P protein subunit POP4
MAASTSQGVGRLYKEVPETLSSSFKEIGIKDVSSGFIDAFLHNRVPNMNQDIDQKWFVMEQAGKPKGEEQSRATKRKTLTSKEKRQLKIFDIEPSCQKYELYLDLNSLWVGYMRKLTNIKNLKLKSPGSYDNLHQQLLKADYHGCVMSVCQSKCPSYVGTTGIVVQETRNTFKLITKDDRLKVIPKANSVFTFELDGFIFTIHGNHFRVKSSERVVKKFKSKDSVEL